MGAFTKGKNKIADSSTITGGQTKKTGRLILLLAILTLVTLFVVGFFYWSKEEGSQSANVCSDEIISEANQNLVTDDFDRLSSLKTTIDSKITSQNNYRSDVNCLYPILVYAAYYGDSELALSHFEDYFKNRQAPQEVSDLYGLQISDEEMQGYIDVFKERQELEQNNSLFFTEE